MARLQPRRRGWPTWSGVAMALVLVVPFALADAYPIALIALICSGVGAGLFGSTQSTLVMAAAPEELRGRALGLLSMAIGALPVGMYVLGESAERLGVTHGAGGQRRARRGRRWPSGPGADPRSWP